MTQPDWGPWEADTIAPFPACPTCNGTDRWQDMRGEWRCCKCERDAGNRAVANTVRMLNAREHYAQERAAGKTRKPRSKPPVAKVDASDIIEQAKRENREHAAQARKPDSD